MRQTDFRRLSRLYHDAFASCLAACSNRYDPALPAVQRLTRLEKELDALLGALVLGQPDRMLHFLHGLDEVCHPGGGVSVPKACEPLESSCSPPHGARAQRPVRADANT